MVKPDSTVTLWRRFWKYLGECVSYKRNSLIPGHVFYLRAHSLIGGTCVDPRLELQSVETFLDVSTEPSAFR